MSPPSQLLRNLRPILSLTLKNTYSQRELDDLIKLCHSLAVSSVRGKLQTGKIDLNHFGLNDSDLAFDCIADLFQRDENGALLHLTTYFESIFVEDASDEALLAHLRRLIFARVNQGLFRLYNEIDPGLGKILRNIKIALHSFGNFTELERFGEHYVVPSFCNPLLHLPEIREEGITDMLRETCSGSERIPDLLAALNSILRKQKEFSRAVRLMAVAYAFRSFFSQSQTDTLSQPQSDQSLLIDDAIRAIHQSCQKVKELNFPQYVSKQKVTSSQYDLYFIAIEDKLKEVIVGPNGEDGSLFDQLKKHESNLTKEQYKRNHKNILEYLLRAARKSVLEELSKE